VPRVAKPFFIPVANNLLRVVVKHGSTGALPYGDTGSGAKGHVAASELTSIGRQGLELRDMWQHQSPPQQGDRLRASGHVAARGYMSSLYACMQGYPVDRVPTDVFSLSLLWGHVALTRLLLSPTVATDSVILVVHCC
jgi:hypothetical protein